MKKLMAILTALMLLVSTCAMAENAVRFADPIVVVANGEDGTTIDLTGMDITIAGGMLGEMPAAQIDVNGNGEKLMGINVNIQGDLCVFAIDGVEGVYYVKTPETVSSISSMSDIDISSLNIDIDLEALAATLMGGIEMDGDIIRVPYTTINDLIEQLAPALDEIGIPGLEKGQLAEYARQLKDADAGLTLEGTYAATEDGFSVSGSALLVNGGETQRSVVDIAAEIGGTLMHFDLAVEPYFSASVELEQLDEGNTLVTIGGNAQGMSAALSGVVSTADVDAAFVELDASNAVDVQSLSQDELEALGNAVMSAASGVMEYVYSAMAEAAA